MPDNVVEKISSLVASIELEEQKAKDSFKSFRLNFFKTNAAYAKDVRYALSLNFKYRTGVGGSFGDRAVLEHAENELKLARISVVVLNGFLVDYRKRLSKRMGEKVLKGFETNLSELKEREFSLKQKILALKNFNSNSFPSLFYSERLKAESDLNSDLDSLQCLYFPAFTETTVMSGIVQEEEASYTEAEATK